MNAATSGHDPDPSSRSPGLIKSTSVVGSMTLLSRIAGLAREIVFARFFGAGPLMDAFFFANRLPNTLRRFFAEGAFSQAFVPVIGEFRATRSTAETRELIAKVSGTLAVVLFAITVLGVIGAPVLVAILGTGFIDDARQFELTTAMLRLTFPYIFFISLTAMAGGVLNTYGRFAVPAFTPVLLNLVLIAAAIWLAPRLEEPTIALAVGVFVAGVVQLAFQLPFLWRQGLLPRPRLGFAHAGVRRIFSLMLPVMFGSSIAQINLMFNTWVATFLAEGSISWLYYSDRLIEFPLGVFGIAIATVILPNLSAQHASASKESFSSTIDWALRSVILIGVPAAIALFLLAEPVLATLFYGGAFTANDVAMSAASLRAFTPGLLGFILVKVLVPGYYSRQDTKTPVRIGIRALAIGVVLNIAFVIVLLQTGWLPPHVGLAAATSISSLANAAMLYRGLVRADVYRARPGWGRLLARVAIACLVMAAGVLAIDARVGDWLAIDSVTRIFWLSVICAGGAAAYFAAGWVTGLRAAQFRSR